jgi:hypothetical protein
MVFWCKFGGVLGGEYDPMLDGVEGVCVALSPATSSGVVAMFFREDRRRERFNTKCNPVRYILRGMRGVMSLPKNRCTFCLGSASEGFAGAATGRQGKVEYGMRKGMRGIVVVVTRSVQTIYSQRRTNNFVSDL